jgi:replicative DNA helicase
MNKKALQNAKVAQPVNTRILYSTEAEQSVLGGLILENKSWDYVEDLISANDFYHENHKVIFKSIAQLLSNNKPVDWVTLCNRLKETKELENAGGENYVIELLKNTPTAANIKHYAEIVRRYSKERQLRSAACSIIDMIENAEESVADEAEKLIFQIREDKASEPKPINDDIDQLFEEIQERKENKGKLLGLSTGFSRIDQVIKGLRKQNLVILGARPSMGKTTLAVNIAEHVGMDRQQPVLIFSLEMSATELKFKILSSLSKVSHENIQTGNLTGKEEMKLAEAIPAFNSAKIYLDDSPGLKMADIRARCRRIKRKYGLGLVMVDYLALINEDKKQKVENETKRISDISRALKGLAKELDIPVLALSQLNREVEKREDKRPIMADLRQSGQIEADADVVMFIYRHGIYYPNTSDKNIAEIIIAKNRSGKPDKVFLTFAGEHSRFDDYFGPEPTYQSEAPIQGRSKGFNPMGFTVLPRDDN